MAEKYNGWSNYETWCVNLWLTNDEGTYRFWKEEARRAIKDSEDSREVRDEGELIKDVARARLAEWLKDALEMTDLLAAGNVYADLLAAALGEVDWQEIAADFLSETEAA
jgi:hypothetical protein